MITADHAECLRQQLILESKLGDLSIKDVAYEKRVIPLSRSRHVRGWHPVKSRHGAIGFESKLECAAISALATHYELLSIRSQPITVSYTYEERLRTYTPDFLVYLSDVPTCLAEMGFGAKTYVEVKPLRMAEVLKERLNLQFAVIRRATGLPIVLLTEVDIPLISGGPLHAR